MNTLKVIAVAAAVVVFALLPQVLPPFYVRVVQIFFLGAGLAVAWNLLGGFAGYWSFGHTVFVGIGGFGAGLLVTKLLGPASGFWGMGIAIPAGGLISAAFAAIIAYPVLRLRGIYFAIAMLGVSQVIAELANNIDWFGGGMGLFLAAPRIEGVPPENIFYYIFGVLLLVALIGTALIRRSKLGYGLLAVREDEDTARMLGVPTEAYKITAFVLSAGVIGLFGAAYAYSLGYFTTYSLFRIDFSLNMIVYTLIGGIGTLLGPIIGAAIMLMVTQVLLSGLLDFHLFITGFIVVCIVLLMPKGLLGLIEDRTASSVSRRSAAEQEATP